MSQSKILVDTNSYLRLAKTVRPLLFTSFGSQEYCLYIIPELNTELSSRRLKSKFPWVDEDEYADNRKHMPAVSRKQRKSIQQNFEYVWGYVQTDCPGPSKVDALYVAYSIELGFPVVTDDQDMTDLASSFDVRVMPTLEILKIMYDCGHVDMTVVNGLIKYWKYVGDRPANFEKDFKRFFNPRG